MIKDQNLLKDYLNYFITVMKKTLKLLTVIVLASRSINAQTIIAGAADYVGDFESTTISS